MQSPGSSFLHDRNPHMHTSYEVEAVVSYLRQGGESIPNEPANKISAYLGFLANREYVNDGILTGDQASINHQIDAHVIKAEDVPEGYFELQRRIAREQGHGDIEITPEIRQEAQRIISADQRHSLRPWAEYLSGDDAGYPDWFKLYAFDGVLKMGKFDKQKAEFHKRSNFTTVPFPELSRGALSQVYSWLKENKIDGQEISGIFDDQKHETAFQKTLKNGNFAQLYVLAIQKTQEGTITPEQREVVEGSWRKYIQGSDPRQLHDDLRGFGLDWCTATGYETAVKHIGGGDFYVYYSRDRDGEDRVPRIAIRMERGEVAEVRGINNSQGLEPELADITAEQLKELPGGEKYIQKAKDMKCLTAIEKRITANPDADLSAEELRFLYEVDHEIQGFGYEDDPRIGEIRQLRGDRDKPELARILSESIRGQLNSAFAAYKTVAEQLGGKQRPFRTGETALTSYELEKLFAAKEKEWQANGTYDYLVEQLIENGARYSLVATPNIEASVAQIIALAVAFGNDKDQPCSTLVSYAVYRQDHYSGRELSGNSGNAPVRLSLIPNRDDDEISNKPVKTKVRLLRERQARRPELHPRVPSLLDAVTYWYALRARGDKLDNSSTFDKTNIQHFDLEPKTVGGWSVVPHSCAHFLGRPHLSRSRAEHGQARLAVG